MLAVSEFSEDSRQCYIISPKFPDHTDGHHVCLSSDELVIHNSGFWKNTTEINEKTFITSSRDIIDDIAEGKGPSNSIFIVGYSGWGPGQLETELMTNSWLSAPYDPAIVFDVDTESRWEKSIDSLGIKSVNISDQIGHA